MRWCGLLAAAVAGQPVEVDLDGSTHSASGPRLEFDVDGALRALALADPARVLTEAAAFLDALPADARIKCAWPPAACESNGGDAAAVVLGAATAAAWPAVASVGNLTDVRRPLQHGPTARPRAWKRARPMEPRRASRTARRSGTQTEARSERRWASRSERRMGPQTAPRTEPHGSRKGYATPPRRACGSLRSLPTVRKLSPGIRGTRSKCSIAGF